MSRVAQAYRRATLWIRTHGVVLRNSGLAIVVFLAAFFFTQWWDFTVPSLGRAQYQAVFLANGQTYFGRYYERIGAYAKIEDVYYLQQSQGADATQAPDTRLLRRGRSCTRLPRACSCRRPRSCSSRTSPMHRRSRNSCRRITDEPLRPRP